MSTGKDLALSASALAHAPILPTANATTEVESRYVVVLKQSVGKAAVVAHMQRANLVLSTQNAKAFEIGALKGYSVQATAEGVRRLAESDEIEYIEPDQTFHLTPNPTFTGATPQHAKRDVQTAAPCNLARISHRRPGGTDYVYERTGGTWVYVLDTGVKVTHVKFEGRAIWGFSAVGGVPDDQNGHGTYVAGVASSQTYGVARFAGVVGVKVLGGDGSGTTWGIIAGINWAVQDMRTRGSVGKATAVLAVGGAYSVALNNAVAAASNAGLFFAVAAGSSNTDNVGSSPGSEPSVCTVGATTIDDVRLPSSNHGAGTAAAHIAGLGAYSLALEGPRGAVALCERLREVATRDALSGIPSGTPNLLAYNLSGL
ncbi:subtilisin-like protein [Bimuria novae-zelandiae CBS 107.79]|uniref:Subtilisin-like protein n=1 Tax=Bimuria novae-zelandiae CBS 107.79 TaxID=1447943 RepID=A0A6A5UVP8_9PLEO|nr:subtilisin-like protein [Bimuria novae-zelandiae CBS 107.79]